MTTLTIDLPENLAVELDTGIKFSICACNPRRCLVQLNLIKKFRRLRADEF